MGLKGVAEEGPGVGLASGLGGGGPYVSCDVNDLSMICLLHIAFADNATPGYDKDNINKPAGPPLAPILGLQGATVTVAIILQKHTLPVASANKEHVSG